MSIKETIVRRILARADNPTAEAPELDWINSEVRLLGKSFGRASRDLQAQIDCGRMIVVRTIKPWPKTKLDLHVRQRIRERLQISTMIRHEVDEDELGGVHHVLRPYGEDALWAAIQEAVDDAGWQVCDGSCL